MIRTLAFAASRMSTSASTSAAASSWTLEQGCLFGFSATWSVRAGACVLRSDRASPLQCSDSESESHREQTFKLAAFNSTQTRRRRAIMRKLCSFEDCTQTRSQSLTQHASLKMSLGHRLRQTLNCRRGRV